MGGQLKYSDGPTSRSGYLFQCHEINVVDSQSYLERIRISRYYNAFGSRNKPNDRIQEAGLPAFNGLTSNIYKCA